MVDYYQDGSDLGKSLTRNLPCDIETAGLC
jgi:hypothetical protein